MPNTAPTVQQVTHTSTGDVMGTVTQTTASTWVIEGPGRETATVTYHEPTDSYLVRVGREKDRVMNLTYAARFALGSPAELRD